MSQSGGFFFIQENGTCLATGRNSNGQMGTGDTTDRKTPYKINLGNISSISSYYENITFFITKNNEVYFSGNVYLADKGSSGNATNPTKLNDSYIYGQSQNSITFIIDKNGKLYEKGTNSYGELGNGSTSSLKSLTLVSTLSNVKLAKTLYYHSIAILEDGSAYMCGQNGYYQCGITSTTNNITSWKKIPLTNIKDVDSPSDNATVFLLKNGDVYVCGYTIYGQIGYNKSQVAALTKLASNIKQIACGRNTTFLVTNDGLLYACGINEKYNLGLGKTSVTTPLTQVTSLTNVKQVVANNYYSTVVLTNDNKVYGVGQNQYGELGLGHTNQVNNWTEITSLRGTVALQNKYVQMLNGFYFNKNNIDYIYENDAQVILNTLQNKKDRKQKIGVISNSYSTKEGTEDLSIKKIVYESAD